MSIKQPEPPDGKVRPLRALVRTAWESPLVQAVIQAIVIAVLLKLLGLQ